MAAGPRYIAMARTAQETSLPIVIPLLHHIVMAVSLTSQFLLWANMAEHSSQSQLRNFNTINSCTRAFCSPLFNKCLNYSMYKCLPLFIQTPQFVWAIIVNIEGPVKRTRPWKPDAHSSTHVIPLPLQNRNSLYSDQKLSSLDNIQRQLNSAHCLIF
jgi:hypothetical protein